ncbi:MAG: hypothetical protein AABY22_01845 [Nanoarchaeota archaeon]|nr:hypothetical protein [Leptospira sp.]
MKSVFSIFSVIIFCLLTLVSCASGTKSRELLYNNNDFAVYSVKRENLSLKSETRVPKTFAHPVQISEQKILDLLGNLKFRRESSYGNINLFAFEEEEIKDFAPDLSDALQKIKTGELLLVISKFNPLKSVVSHYVRTSFYMWSTDKTIEIVFGEIQKEIEFDEQGNYYDWSRIPEISFDNTADAYSVIPNSAYAYKQVEGFKNKRWLVFNKSEIENIKFEKRKSKVKEVSKTIESDMSTPEKRVDRDEEDAIIQD